MYFTFHSLDSLFSWIDEDKNWKGADSVIRNRYPIRFVLFDNFADFYAFVDKCSNHGIFTQSMEHWMKEGSDEILLTYSQIGKRFTEHIKLYFNNDFVIAPFSEVTRFYDNNEQNHEFDSLVKTIGIIESDDDAQQNNKRIYVPIVGMQRKMDKFKNSPNIFVIEYISELQSQNYHLILTNGSFYGVLGLEFKYSLCSNMREWISLWKKGDSIKNNIICCSKTLFNNEQYAKPDNAFDYVVCRNVYEFLTKGLHVDFGNVLVLDDELCYWEELARDVNVNDFDFNSYIADRFNVVKIDDIVDFLQIWSSYNETYSRWLLKTFYIVKTAEDTYLKRVLTRIPTLSSSDLYSTIATLIFEESCNDMSESQRNAAVSQRASALLYGTKNNTLLTERAERIIDAKLKAIKSDPERGVNEAMKYISPMTGAEKHLLTKWFGDNAIRRDSIKSLYSDLYNYVTPFSLSVFDSVAWINEYFTEYCKSKMGNTITANLTALLTKNNSSSIAFESWRDQFKTVKTLLYGREDIDVYYWIDGLGVDWVPYICSIIKEHEVENVYLNEVLVATAELPTRTSNNKIKLQELCGGKLKKIGDLDSSAHQSKKYPDYIEDEFKLMREAIDSVLAQYNGKKIAFVSDHGISYLASHEPGLNMAAIKGDHFGRCGEWTNGKPSNDNNYIILEDGKTICSLNHRSLTSKVPDGQGAHGGATPEEVLVPIIIVSSQKNASNYSALLQTNQISAMSPVVLYTIKGLNSIDLPVVEYNGVEYKLKKVSSNTYESERLALVDTAKLITLRIGDFELKDTLVITTGVEEDDLGIF